MGKQKKIMHRAELLELIARHHFLITVAGTHGKTSTTGLVAHALDSCQQEPNALIGASLLSPYLSPTLFGPGNSCVVELDESDGSFLKFKPDIAIITNIDLYKEYQLYEFISKSKLNLDSQAKQRFLNTLINHQIKKNSYDLNLIKKTNIALEDKILRFSYQSTDNLDLIDEVIRENLGYSSLSEKVFILKNPSNN